MKIPLVLVLAACSIGCSSPATNRSAANPAPAKFDLPPVYAVPRGLYAPPGCPNYNRLPAQMRIEIPTAQEAELMGYRPIGSCQDHAKARIEEELRLIGKVEATPETKRRKAELARYRFLRNEQERLESKQQELESRQEELDH
jgi:hypothetical protein